MRVRMWMKIIQPFYNQEAPYLPIRKNVHLINYLTVRDYKKHEICEHFQCTVLQLQIKKG